MGYALKQSQTAQPLVFRLFETGTNTPATSAASISVTISKNGGSFNAPVGAVSEIGNGYYQVAGNATDSSTLGPLLLHASATDCDETQEEFIVVAYDPQAASNLGLTNLNAAIDTRATPANVAAAQSAIIDALPADVDTSAIADAVVDGVEREGGMLAQVADNSGTGAYTVTVTVTDGTNALQNATVRLSEGGNSYTTKTNASGVATFALDAATYALAVTKAGYSFTPTTMVVDAEHTEFAAAMTQVTVAAPDDPTLCRVTANPLRTPDGAAAKGAEVQFRLVAPGAVKNGGVIYGRLVTAKTDMSGVLDVQLIRNDATTPAGTQWQVDCNQAQINGALITLDGATYDLSTLVGD